MLRRHFLALACSVMLPLGVRAEDSAPAAAPAGDGAGEAPVSRRFMMQDVNGEVVTDENLKGRYTLIYFGYTNCPDICPTSLLVLANALKALDKDKKSEKVLPLFVTVDPDRDTAKHLSEYVQSFDERIVALRGPKAYTDAMVKAYNAKYEIKPADPDDPTHYTVDHTASIALVGPDGVLIKRYPYGTTAEQMAEDLAKVMAAHPAP